MGTPPTRDLNGGADERLPLRRPANAPAAAGEALVEHLVERLASVESQLRAAQADAMRSEGDRAVLGQLARLLVEHEGPPLTDVVRLALPVLGAWCVIEVIGGESAERLVVAVDPQHEEPLRALAGGIAVDGVSVGLGRALRSGRIERLHVMPPDMRAAFSVELARSAITAGPALVVPIASRGRITAALSFGRDEHAPGFGAAEQRLAGEVASLVALAIEQRRAAVVADAAARAKSEFLTMMSHELRTPLNAIAGYAQLLEMGFRGPLNEPQRDAVARILRGQEHLLELVDSVLTFSRLTSGRLVLDTVEMPVKSLIELASQPIVADFAARGISFHIAGCADDVHVCADRHRAPEIVRHLLSNALKFTPEGGSVTLSCEPGTRTVRIIVTDTGRGIPAAQRESIFHPFVQVEKGHTRSADGSGLGLAIGRELAERMGGSLTVTSEVGVGSRFVLSLAKPDVRTPEVEGSASPSPSIDTTGRQR